MVGKGKKAKQTEEMTRVAPADGTPQYDKPPGPISNRSCRDVFFLILFAAYWVGMIALAILAITNGDTRRLILPSDSYGNLCGIANTTANSTQQLDLTTKPFLYFFNPTQQTSLEVCVSSCPSNASITIPTYAAGNYICTYGLTNVTSESSLVQNMQAGLCAPVLYQTTPVFGRCMPSGNLTAALLLNAANSPAASNAVFNTTALISLSKDVTRNLLQDVATTWQYMLAALGICLVLCFIWIVILRFFAGFFTILTIIAVEGVLGALAYYTYQMWQTKSAAFTAAQSNGTATDQTKNERDVALALFIICASMAGIFFIMIISLRKRIRIAIKIVKEASRAVGSMPMIVLFPIIPFIGIVTLTAYYLAIAAYIATTPDTTNLSTIGVNMTITYIKYFQWYHLFGFFWTLAFLIGINQTTLAGAIATWYWSRDKKNLPSFPVIKAFYRTIRYSMGSIAIGALLIAIVQIIRVLIFYAQTQLRKSKNRVALAILTCMQCCFACVERLLKFINKNAYIMIAVNGTSFCTAARTATELLVRNAFRLVAIDFVAGFLLLLSKVAVAVGTAGGLYIVLTYTNQSGTTQVQLIGGVCILVFIAAWVIVSCFFGVYRMAVDTIFLSFCEDCERNDGSPEKPYFMSSGLAALLDVKVTGPPMQAETKG